MPFIILTLIVALTFPRAPLVAKGDPVTSTQQAGISTAVNARLRAGLGDPCARIFYYLWSLFRTIRNCDASGLVCPPNAEFFELYQMLNPEAANWPIESPGDPEGARLSNPMAAYVFGSASAALDSEHARLSDPFVDGVPLRLPSGVVASTPTQIWDLGKRQRGAFDPVTGAVASPAFRAAREFYKLTTSLKSALGNAYGGFMPIPQILGDCGDGTADVPATINYQIFFTRLDPAAVAPANVTDTGATIKYNGTCPAVTGDVISVYDLPWAYYVYRVGGVIDYLPSNKWVEGPYSAGASLKRTQGKHWGRVLSAFSREFRGSESQRAAPGYHLQHAADNQKFFTSQYLLAPNIGTQISSEFIYSQYPRSA